MTQPGAGTSQPPLLRELIPIPERIHRGDFVLKLTEGVEHRAATLDSYVVTPQLLVAFDEALGVIGSALAESSSKATYLHGSFGSGKSHFMAVLHALLDGDVAARDKPGFGKLISRYGWLGEKRFLLVPYHLTGSESLEAALLGGYVDHVRRHHPDAALPPVYRVQGLLDDARQLRDRMGTEEFLKGLAPSSDPGWGTLSAPMTADELDHAFGAPVGSPESDDLIAKVIEAYFPNYVDSVRGAANAFVPIDQGLAAISQHARSLGYDAVVLFLDELVLWLAGKIGNPEFIARETEKVAKLVESGDARRPAPIISFIARQRDLRELGIGAERTGAELQSFHDHLNYWDGRIGRITLEDRNLRAIAEQRVLKPYPGKEQTIRQAFERTGALPAGVRDVLLGSGDADAFRQTYPFSPTFVDVLVHVSSALQRERTALLLMKQILVNRRDEFRLGQLVPLGDLFDAIADGADQPFTDKLKHEFDQARNLYQRTLRPILLHDRGLNDDQVAGLAEANPAAIKAFHSDDRLVKTLLLAALAPDVPALRDLTARKLAALNHGTITTPIPGQEVGEVVRRLRRWASRVAELQVGEGADPSVRLNLVGVNLGAILERVTHLDNQAGRRRLIRDLLFEELRVKDTGTMFVEHRVAWRGSQRTVEIVYGNVRDRQELRDEMFEPSQSDRWRFVIDFPFDAETHSAADDRTRVLGLRETLGHTQCVAWLPAFFTADTLDKVSRLVRVDYLLDANHLDENAGHLGAEDRQRARDLLRNLQGSLRSELKDALRNAYGLLARPREEVVQDWTDHLVSLDPGVTPRLDVGRPFADALVSVVDQLYAATYPKHPDFDPHRKGEVLKDGDLRTVLDVVRQAADAPENRVEVDKPYRDALRRIAHPLRIGEEHGGPFVLDRHWESELERMAAREGIAEGTIPVRRVRHWLREYGLERRVENLLIATYAELTHRGWMRNTQTIEAPSTPDAVTDELTLHRQVLPSAEDWTLACARAGSLTGVDVRTTVISPRAVARLARVVGDKVDQLRLPAVELVEMLEEYADRLGLDTSASTGRYATAVTGSRLLTDLYQVNDPTELVAALARADLRGIEPVVISRSLESARAVSDALRRADWDVLDHLKDPRAADVRETLRRNANANEQAASLARALDTAKRELIKILFTPEPPLPPPPPPPQGPEGSVTGTLDTVLAALRSFAEEHPGARIEVRYRAVGPEE
ncbi:phage resistance protein [Gandjariella thermophila]|uniref:Phage resistance protein n=1 Tax=Gandjariella thermophila TaxID=1931992 RepID=A0A4D4JGM6_9PSEU|nr:phage resistance protein [Gandjariella thermophila]GDY33047.1 hypothetical protein GTS_46800 [Gandjariella thermophila]